MHRLTSIVLITVFIFWLIPLGIFISPSKEKLLCDGQRAVCLCSHGPALAAKKEDMGKTLVKASSPVKKESSSSGNYFLLSKTQNSKDVPRAIFCFEHQYLYRLVVSKPVEHVPKV